MHKSKIHFQQVPLEVVAKILERRQIRRKEHGKSNHSPKESVIVERPLVKTEPYSVHNVE